MSKSNDWKQLAQDDIEECEVEYHFEEGRARRTWYE